MAISVTELRKGVTFESDGEIYRVLEYQHQKMGRGSATIRCKLRNLRSGAIIDRTFPNGSVVDDIRLDNTTAQYLYNDGDNYYFMDTESFEQMAIPAKTLGDATQYLKENMNVDLESYNGEPIDVELPTTVDLEVMETAPGFKGDTASGGGKPATVETGLRVNVPFFVNQGDIIRVDTRTGEYVTRVQG